MERATSTGPKIEVECLPLPGTEERTLEEESIASVCTLSTDIISQPSWLYHLSKRVIDIFLAVLGLIVMLLVFLIIAICIKLGDRGNVFYFREIIGKNGKRFYALKFRTMRPDADSYLEKHLDLKAQFLKNMKLRDDPRVTRVGRFLRKTSLDEMPQLFNVLLGQMSLVGPRIIHPSELPRYGRFSQKRLSVLPGMTGLWQISGRQHISYEERVIIDMTYIDTRSCFGDLLILLKTLKVLIIHTGV
jgi:lipopolysaccharide/colanic/teichoic acid biosynthesis glycosyltransferase